MRGGCAAPLRPMPRVPGRYRLAPRDRTDEAPQHSQLGTCRNPEIPAACTGGVAASDYRQGSGELMLTVLILIVFAVIVLVLVLLAVVVVAIRQEPHDAEMSNVAPSLIAV